MASVDSAGIFSGFVRRHDIVVGVDEFVERHLLHILGNRHVIAVAVAVSFVTCHVLDQLVLVSGKGVRVEPPDQRLGGSRFNHDDGDATAGGYSK